MNEHITKVSLAEVVEGDRTDWTRLETLSELDIESAIASDEDTFAIAESGKQTARYQVYQTASSTWRWRLIDSAGGLLAESGGDFQTKALTLKAIAMVRSALVHAKAA